MRIAQVAPLMESVPPKNYGGTERIVSYLTEALVERGHAVTLFASGGSATAARLLPQTPKSLRLSVCKDNIAPHLLMTERVLERSGEFDIIHSHMDYLFYPAARRARAPVVTTLHGRLDIPELSALYREYRDMRLVSISNAQRAPLAWANWAATVYHGIPAGLLRFTPRSSGTLAFLGRISPEKRLDRAIAIARRVGLPLRVAAKIDRADEEYFRREIFPLMRDPGVEYFGEITEDQKGEFLGNACALLFPIDWNEPFGLVMIEAMACGTPVIAFRGGSVEEVVEDGVTGFICESVEQAAEAARRCVSMDRLRIRKRFEERFTAQTMVDAYLAVYEREIRWAAPGGGRSLVRNH